MRWPTFTFEDKQMTTLKDRITVLEDYQVKCQADHIHHKQYRRDTDNKMDGILTYQKSTDETVKKMLSIMEEYKPTLKRSTNNYITLDTLKSWALWLAAIVGGLSAFDYIKGIM